MRCTSTPPVSAETISTVAIWSIGIDVLPSGVARTPLTAIQSDQSVVIAVAADHHQRQLGGGFVPVGSRSARFRWVGAVHVDLGSPALAVTATVAVSSVGAIGVIVTADASVRGGTEAGAPEWNCTPAGTPITVTTAAAQVAKRALRRRRLTVASSDVNTCEGGASDPPVTDSKAFWHLQRIAAWQPRVLS